MPHATAGRSRAIDYLRDRVPVGSPPAPTAGGAPGALNPMQAPQTTPQAMAVTTHPTGGGGLSAVAPGLLPEDEETMVSPETIARIGLGAPSYGSVEAAGLPTAAGQLMGPEEAASAGPFAHALAPGDVASATSALPSLQIALSDPRARAVIDRLLGRAVGERGFDQDLGTQTLGGRDRGLHVLFAQPGEDASSIGA